MPLFHLLVTAAVCVVPSATTLVTRRAVVGGVVGGALGGQVPPPIRRSLAYDDFLAEARAHKLASVQPMVQHGGVVGTTLEGERWACRMPDADFYGRFLLEALDPQTGELPFRVLPPDATRAAVRHFASVAFRLFLVAWAIRLALFGE